MYIKYHPARLTIKAVSPSQLNPSGEYDVVNEPEILTQNIDFIDIQYENNQIVISEKQASEKQNIISNSILQLKKIKSKKVHLLRKDKEEEGLVLKIGSKLYAMDSSSYGKDTLNGLLSSYDRSIFPKSYMVQWKFFFERAILNKYDNYRNRHIYNLVDIYIDDIINVIKDELFTVVKYEEINYDHFLLMSSVILNYVTGLFQAEGTHTYLIDSLSDTDIDEINNYNINLNWPTRLTESASW